MPADQGGGEATARVLTPTGRVAAGVACLVGLAGCGWLEAAMPPFRVGSTVVTFSAAAVVLVFGATVVRRGFPAPVSPEWGGAAPFRLAGQLCWLAACLLALSVELWELAHGPRHLYPTLSSIANDVIGPGHRAARAVAFVCWGACGLALSWRPKRWP
jgi:hypothetical protein